MRRTVWLMLLVLFSLGLIPAEADAQLLCEDPNLYALFFDYTGASIINLNDIDPYSTFSLYLFLMNPETDCLGGFELEVLVPDQSMVLATDFPSEYINIGDGTNLIVGFGYPQMATDNLIHLCTFNVMYMSTAGLVQDFYLSPATPASIEGEMVYLTCSETLVITDPISMDFALPVARVNGTEPLEYCTGTSINGVTIEISRDRKSVV